MHLRQGFSCAGTEKAIQILKAHLIRLCAFEFEGWENLRSVGSVLFGAAAVSDCSSMPLFTSTPRAVPYQHST